MLELMRTHLLGKDIMHSCDMLSHAPLDICAYTPTLEQGCSVPRLSLMQAAHSLTGTMTERMPMVRG